MKKIHKLKPRGFSLIELLVSIIVASVLILLVGILSNIALSSYEDLRKEDQVFKDVFYGLDTMQFSVRKASAVSVVTWANPPWKSNMLIVDNSAFGLYQAQGSPTRDLVYLPDKNNTSNRVILSYNLDSSTTFFPSVNIRLVSVQIQGKRDNESFNLYADVTRRN